MTVHTVFLVAALVSLPALPHASAGNAGPAHQAADAPRPSLVETVRRATESFRDVGNASPDYTPALGCVSGPQEGAMGVHYIDGSLVDGVLDAEKPEALIYEFKDGAVRLVGVEYIVPAAAWHETHPPQEPPVLQGQLLHFVDSPNRFGLPAFYELHVWAWLDNPLGTFSDWNPRVTCERP